jgi:hypothetical protein
MSGICERLGVKFPGPTRQRRVKSPGQDLGQVSVGKTSGSKPFEDASLTYQELSKPGVMLSPGTSPRGA